MANEGTMLGGAISGAVGGATLGSTAGPAGTLAGGIIGAIASGASAAFKASADEKRRNEEVKRLERREDNAQRRAVADSLAAGIDPRTLDKPINPANAQSVEPYQELEQSSNIGDAFSAASSVLNNRFINESRIQDSAINSLTEAYKERKIAAQNGLNETDSEIEKWAADFKELTINSNETEKAFSTRITSEIKDLTRKLKSVKITADKKKEILQAVKKSGGDKESDTAKIGGGGDYLSTALGAIDSYIESSSRFGEKGGEKVVPPSKPSEPKFREFYVNPETGQKYVPKKEDAVWHGPRTSDGRPAYKDSKGDLRPLDVGREEIKPTDNKPSKITENQKFKEEGKKEGQKKRKQDQKGGRVRLSGEYSDYDEKWSSQETNNNTTTTEGSSVGFTNDEITEIVKAYSREQFNLARGKNKDEFHTYDFESKLLKFENLTRLYQKRADYLEEYQQSPLDFFNNNYTYAYEFYRKIYNPYKFFRK